MQSPVNPRGWGSCCSCSLWGRQPCCKAGLGVLLPITSSRHCSTPSWVRSTSRNSWRARCDCRPAVVPKSHTTVSGTPQTGKAAVLGGIQMQIEKCFKKKIHIIWIVWGLLILFWTEKLLSWFKSGAYIFWNCQRMLWGNEWTCFRVRRSTETNYYTSPWKPSCLNVD